VSVAAPPYPAARFLRRLEAARRELRADEVATLQVNLGRLCNQACRHCHLSASPSRTELASDEVLDACLRALARYPEIATLDITAGAPELHPRFRELVERARDMGRAVMVRHNLTVQFEKDQSDLPSFFARQGVEVIGSLPHYLAPATDRQRGSGVFDKSIQALRALNDVGYGRQDALKLTLVANPTGAFLPPRQEDIERDMRDHLESRYDVCFDRLFAFTNMPVGRFAEWLQRTGIYDEYLCRLETAFNPSTLPAVMCRSLVSVAYDGRLHDCDFNQALGMGLEEGRPQSIFDFDRGAMVGRRIRVGDHCFGCTAGAGSSCGGALATEDD
jgi:radical SAM/Cys-rich protein